MKRGVLVALLLAGVICYSSALSFTADAGKETCFYDELKNGDAVSFMYQVTQGGALDIDLTVNAPGGVNILRRQRETEGVYTFNARVDGLFSLCFGNTMSTFTEKDITFDWDVQKTGTGIDKLAKEEQLTPLGNQIVELASSFANFQAEQKYLKMREMRMRNTNEATTSSVVMWSLIECGALILAAFFQVYNLKRFFEDRRSL